jgi:DNA-binding protein HU-beta
LALTVAARNSALRSGGTGQHEYFFSRACKDANWVLRDGELGVFWSPWVGSIRDSLEELALNKAELVDVVAKEAGTTKKDAEQVINKMMETIIKHIASGEKVTLVGFGTFEARQRKARTGRNPKTNEPLHIPAKRVPGFRVGKEFSEAVNKRK